jgi:hypothetical protein
MRLQVIVHPQAGAMVRMCSPRASLGASAALIGALPAIAATAAALVLLPAAEGLAQEKGYGQTLGTSPMERQFYEYGPGNSGSGGTILESTNPLDLMNKLRRSTALDEATPPGSAVDQAIRDFDAQMTKPAPAGSSGSLKGI